MNNPAVVSQDEFAQLFAGAARFSTLVLAVSGGPDSMALVHLAARWLGNSAEPRPRAIVATVDHRLRPQSGQEARFVHEAAAALGLPHETLAWTEAKPASGLQAAAREARYRLLAALARRMPQPAAIVTAHTRDDQAETVLMRLARGSGLDGLAAMAEESEIEGVALLRPLLDIPKQRLIATLEELGVRSIEDPSNELDQFERVRLRRARPSRDALDLTDAALALSARRLRRARAALEAATSAFLATLRQDMPVLALGAFEWISGAPAANAEIEIRALRRILGAIGGLAAPVPLAQVEALHSDLCRPGFGGTTVARCRLKPRARRLLRSVAEPERPVVLITRETGREPLPELALEPGETRRWDGRFDVGLAHGFAQPVTVRGVEREALKAFAAATDGQSAHPRLPATVLYGLPAFWRGSELLDIPNLKRSSGPPVGRQCWAKFAAPALD